MNNSAKTLQWTGHLTDQWSFQGDALVSATPALEYSMLNQEGGILGVSNPSTSMQTSIFDLSGDWTFVSGNTQATVEIIF